MVIGNSVQNEKSIGKIITGAEQTRPLNNKKEVGSGATEELASSADRSHQIINHQTVEVGLRFKSHATNAMQADNRFVLSVCLTKLKIF